MKSIWLYHLSPDEVLLKRNAILYHQSQKRQGNVSRERFERIWVRAEDRNKETAKQYDALGLQNTKLLRLLNDLTIRITINNKET
jgi:hypothetical protein